MSKELIDKWKNIFKLNHWDILDESIQREQVEFPDDIEEGEEFFTGIEINEKIKLAIIFHDTPLTEEDVVHELLHLMLPDADEESVVILTRLLMEPKCQCKKEE